MEITHSLDDTDNFFKQLQGLKDRKYLTDFIIKVGTEEIACHKIVLAARSEYFQRLFNHESTQEVKQGSVDLKRLEYHTVKAVIDYCYTGKLQFKLDDAKHLIEITEYLQMPVIQAKISTLIIDHMTVDNCIDWYFFADLFRRPELKDKARDIMCINFGAVSDLPAFLAMDYDNMIEYITWDEIDCDASLDAACRWVMHDARYRQDFFQDILQTIDVNSCSANCLSHVIANYKTSLTSAGFYQKLVDALLSKSPKWQTTGRGAGYDVIVAGGQFGYEENKKSWMINIKTCDITGKASQSSDTEGALNCNALCSNSLGAFFIGGSLRYDADTGVYRDKSTQSLHYDKANNTWKLLRNIPESFGHAGAATCMGETKLFVFGGLGSDSMLCYNLSEETWSSCPHLLQAVTYPIVESVGEFIYVVFSTYSFNECFRHGSDISLQQFDTRTSTWSFKASLPESVSQICGARTATIAHYLYVVGGAPGLCLRYDTHTDSWTTLTPPLERHYLGAALSLKGKIILCGGGMPEMSKLSETDYIESYDPDSDTWTLLPLRLPKPLRNLQILA